jgi:hypothetical protein
MFTFSSGSVASKSTTSESSQSAHSEPLVATEQPSIAPLKSNASTASQSDENATAAKVVSSLIVTRNTVEPLTNRTVEVNVEPSNSFSTMNSSSSLPLLKEAGCPSIMAQSQRPQAINALPSFC